MLQYYWFMDFLIIKTEDYVKKTLAQAEGGHDWFHIERVWRNAIAIIENEPKADRLVVELAALLHDIADSKFHNGNELIGGETARRFLSSIDCPNDIIDHVCNIINSISYKGGKEEVQFRSLECDIVQDADRLDALGAIGIARAFNYGGFKNRALFDPEILPNLTMTKEEYKNSNAPTINHFYEKLLSLKNRLNTPYGKVMGEERHVFLLTFLDQFYKEWYGDDFKKLVPETFKNSETL